MWLISRLYNTCLTEITTGEKNVGGVTKDISTTLVLINLVPDMLTKSIQKKIPNCMLFCIRNHLDWGIKERD